MDRTAQLALPLLAPAQAQKHVTVNEAFVRLDAAAQLRVVSSSAATPPNTAEEGAGYVVPIGGTGAWLGKVGQIAVRCNGGWVFLAPKTGWRAWDEASGGSMMFDGVRWIENAVALSSGGAATISRILEFEHTIAAGGSNLTGQRIPASAQVLGVTGRVTSPITGVGLSGWKIGVAGSADRYGAGLGMATNSYVLGMSGAPVTYYADTPLLLSAEGGAFSGGRVRLAVHLLELKVPREV